MKTKSAFTALALAGTLAFIPACGTMHGQQARSGEVVNEPWYVQQQPPSQTMQRQQMAEQQLTSFEDLKGLRVQNALGEELGSIDRLIVDTQHNRIAYAVVSTGGVWNLAGGKAIVPWNAFQLQPARDGGEQLLILDIPREQLAIAPPSDIDLLDPEMGRQIHEFYGVSPYWTE